ncbi:MAG: ATP-dependent RecD-like DNA helicase [Bacillota bacterium]
MEGTVEKISYRQEDNFFTVARLKKSDSCMVTLVGYFHQLAVGEQIVAEGDWVDHPDYGEQFKVSSYRKEAPVSIKGMENFLGSGLIKGIGPSTARKIVGSFGLESLDVIESHPERLQSVEGIGPKKAETIAGGFKAYKEVSNIMVFLQGYGIFPSQAMKIYKTYGAGAVEVIRRNPYQLAEDVFGIGFVTADQIARKMGMPEDSPQRIRSAILYWLGQISDDGHVFAWLDEFIKEMEEKLGVNTQLLTEILQNLLRDKLIFCEKDETGHSRLYLAPFYYAEKGVAERLCELASCVPEEYGKLAEKALADMEKEIGIKLEDKQWEAVQAFLKHSVLVLTGGPGTGKTTTIKSLLHLAGRFKSRVALAAPTGRAAKRMAEATEKEAKTIHRLLEFSPREGQGYQFGRNDKNQLSAEVVIIDETSMVDLLLMYNLLKALKPGVRLVLVGDVDQLPSVGAGNVLRDIISSGIVPVVRLKAIFRQARESMIIQNAHRINQGQYPFLKGNNDFFLIEREDPEEIVRTILGLMQKRLPSYLGTAAWEDLQVLSPMRRTVTGVDNLNRVLQEALNPPKESGEEQRDFMRFRPGDKVMQIRNNYLKLVFNGDIGVIEGIDYEEKEVRVNYPEPGGYRTVFYDFNELDELTLAYAISVHKSQGSEYKAVVLVLTTQHYMMLQRNLLYTAVTRARDLVVIVGAKKALAIAVRNSRQEERRTFLSRRLKDGFGKLRAEEGNLKLFKP